MVPNYSNVVPVLLWILADLGAGSLFLGTAFSGRGPLYSQFCSVSGRRTRTVSSINPLFQGNNNEEKAWFGWEKSPIFCRRGLLFYERPQDLS
jgi:hypothetical protein